MSFIPDRTDYIDIHSHRPYRGKDEFRIFNHLLTKDDPIPAEMPVSCGLHPWHIRKYEDLDNLYEELSSYCERENVVALGETGIDKVIETALDVQEEIFRVHIDVAAKYNKPLIVHCVRAADMLLKIRKECNADQPWIYHGFNSSAQMAGDLYAHGIYISVGKKLLVNREKLKAILDNVPLSGIFAETDDDKADIREVYEEMAEVAGIEVAELKEYISGNYRKLTA